GEADHEVQQRAGRLDRGEQQRDAEREGEPDEQLLDDQPDDLGDLGRQRLAGDGERVEAEREGERDDRLGARRDLPRGEQRRDEEERCDAGEHEEEADDVSDADRGQQLAGRLLRLVHPPPTSVGIERNSSSVYDSSWLSIHGPPTTSTTAVAMIFGMK